MLSYFKGRKNYVAGTILLCAGLFLYLKSDLKSEGIAILTAGAGLLAGRTNIIGKVIDKK